MALTKADIIESIYNQCGFSKIKSTDLAESILEIIKRTLESGEDVLISGFGKLCVNDPKFARGLRIRFVHFLIWTERFETFNANQGLPPLGPRAG